MGGVLGVFGVRGVFSVLAVLSDFLSDLGRRQTFGHSMDCPAIPQQCITRKR